MGFSGLGLVYLYRSDSEHKWSFANFVIWGESFYGHEAYDTPETKLAPLIGWTENEKKCSVSDLGGTLQMGENQRNQVVTKIPILM